MTDTTEFTRLLGIATLQVWGDLPRDIQETLFESAIRERPDLRHEMATLLHERHPRTDHRAASA